MADVIIHDVDPKTLRRLAQRAEANGRSLDEEVRAMIEETMPSDEDMETLRRASDESLARFRGRIFSDSTDDIREDRER